MRVPSGWTLSCVSCGDRLSADPKSFACPKCGEILELKLGRRPSRKALLGSGRSGVWRYSASLPVSSKGAISLEEGGTPLVKSRHLGKVLGLSGLHFKVEGQNPTGSFKDRGMTVAVTRAVESSAKVLICASTGNTAASLAAYSARAGVKSAVVLPSGKVATGKLTQAIAHGAKLIQVQGNFDEALKVTTEAVSVSDDLYILNSINPYRIEGQKTAAVEIFEQLRGVPDYLVLPVGNAGNISAYWKGFSELKEWGIAKSTPKMIGVQAEGAAPLAEAVSSGKGKIRAWRNPETAASAIRIGNPVSWRKALRAVGESGGKILSVPDEEILLARKDLATKEGVFVENASASPIAGLRALEGKIPSDASVVCVLTGNGLKDELPSGWAPKSFPVVGSAEDLIRALRG